MPKGRDYVNVLKNAVPLKLQEPPLLCRIQMSSFYTKHLSLLQALIQARQSVHLTELQDYLFGYLV